MQVSRGYAKTRGIVAIYSTAQYFKYKLFFFLNPTLQSYQPT